MVDNATSELAVLDAALLRRIAAAFGRSVKSAHAIHHGYSSNRRWLIRCTDETTAFVKRASDPPGAAWLRREHIMYQFLDPSLRAEFLGWDDDEAEPLLVLEDMSAFTWPPPWDTRRIAATLDLLTQVARHEPPPDLPTIGQTWYAEMGWPEVARDPAPFLRLGLCSRTWLEAALPTLLSLSDPTALAGDALLHLDVRSDNICIRPDRAVLIDWNHVALGRPDFDVAFWLPSLRMEGGPEPEEVQPHPDPVVVAQVAGFFASRAGLPLLPTMPRVRDVQLRQLRVALPWMVRVLGLPPLS